MGDHLVIPGAVCALKTGEEWMLLGYTSQDMLHEIMQRPHDPGESSIIRSRFTPILKIVIIQSPEMKCKQKGYCWLNDVDHCQKLRINTFKNELFLNWIKYQRELFC